MGFRFSDLGCSRGAPVWRAQTGDRQEFFFQIPRRTPPPPEPSGPDGLRSSQRPDWADENPAGRLWISLVSRVNPVLAGHPNRSTHARVLRAHNTPWRRVRCSLSRLAAFPGAVHPRCMGPK